MIPIQEVHEQFLHWYDKQSNYSAPEITPEEIDIYLNNGLYQLLEILTEEGIEKNQDWLDYTKNITSYYTVSSFSNGTKPQGYLVKLPDNYRLALLEEATINYLDCNGVSTSKRVTVTPATRDEYNKIINNPFKKPWKEEIIRLTSNNGYYELVGFPGFSLVTYHLDYIREPLKMQYGSAYATPQADQDCELDNKATTKVIEMAVKSALKTLGDPRIQLEQMNKQIKTID